MKLWIHQVKGNLSSTFPFSYWLKYPQKISGISIRIGKREFAIGNAMTTKKFIRLISEPKKEVK